MSIVSEQEIRAAIESNLYHLWTKATTLCAGQLCVNNEFSYAKTTMGWPNNIFSCRIDKAIESTIRKIAQEMKSGNYPATLTVGPQSTPHNLGEYLLRAGFQKSR